MKSHKIELSLLSFGMFCLQNIPKISILLARSVNDNDFGISSCGGVSENGSHLLMCQLVGLLCPSF